MIIDIGKDTLMKIIKYFFILLFPLILTHCAELMKIAQQGNVQKPAVRVSSARLAGLSFDQADLIFDIEISNPNSVGVSLAGFDYDLLLNNQSFLKGDQKDKTEIKANDIATLQLPLSLNYANIYQTYQSLKNSDDVTYKLDTGFSFDMPILGPVRVPVSTSGQVPMVKLPRLSVKSIKLDRLNLTGADFDISLGIDNPNAWGLVVNALQYGLKINGTEWISGQTNERLQLNEKGESVLHLPFSLSFLKIGSSVYNIIANGKGLNYTFTGQTDLSSSLEMLGDFKLPFDLSGKIDLLK